MAQQTSGNGSTGGFGGAMKHTIGNIAQYFKAPSDLTPLPGQRKQGSDGQDFGLDSGDDGGDGNRQQPANRQQQGKQPSGSTNKGATNDPESLQNPLDVYAGMFDNKPQLDKDGKPVPVTEAPKFKLDPKTIQDAASKLDFNADLPAELSEKMQSGQPLTAAEYAQLSNHAGARAYAHAMEHASTLTDRFIEMRLQHESQGLGKQVSKLLAKNLVSSDPAIANNPILKEQYESIADRLSTKFPDQSPEWIVKQTKQYFMDMAKAANPNLREIDPNAEEQQERTSTDKDGTFMKGGKVFDWQGYLK